MLFSSLLRVLSVYPQNSRRGRRRRSAGQPIPLVRPRLEILEDRTVLSTVHWIGGSGDWSTATNWDKGSIPGAGDDVVINVAGINVTHTSSANESIHSLNCTDVLSFSNGSLTLAAASTISNNLIFSGGTISGAGSLTITGTLTWSGGVMNGTGTTFAQGGLSLGGVSGSEFLDTRSFVNSGAATWTGANDFYILNGAVFTNSGTFAAQNNQNIFTSVTTATFVNSGTFTKSPGTGTTNINTFFLNTNAVTVSSGTLALNGGGTSSGSFSVAANATLTFGGHTLLSPASGVSGAGSVAFITNLTDVQGTYNITGNTTVTGGVANFTGTLTSVGAALTVTNSGTAYFNQDFSIDTMKVSQSGILTGPSAITVNKLLTWDTFGVMSGTGSTSVASTATLTIDSTSNETLDTRTLNNAGTANWTNKNDIYLYNGAVLNNSGTFNIQNNQNIFIAGNSGSFNNSGSVVKSPSTGLTTVNSVFNNSGSGTVTVSSGALALAGGGSSAGAFSDAGILNFGGGITYLSPSSSITGAGTVNFVSGTTTFLGTYNISGKTVVNGGVANIGGTLTSVGSVLTVTNSATANFTQNFTVATLNLNGSATLTGPSAITVSTKLAWTGGATMSGTGSTTVSATTGTMVINGTSTYVVLDTRTLINAGAAAWGGTTDIYMQDGATFTNASTGTFTIQNNQNINWTSGVMSVISNAGTITKTPGTSPTNINPRLLNNGTLKVATGTVNLYGGGISAGVFNVAAGAVLQFANYNSKLTSKSSVTGAGSLIFASGNNDVLGTYNLSGTASMTTVSGGTMTFLGVMTRVGTSLVINNGSTAYFSPAFKVDNLTLSGATLTGPGDITVNKNLLWTSSFMGGSGSTTLAAGGTGTLGGAGSTSFLDTRTFQNGGTLTWSGVNDLAIQNGATFNNLATGVFNIQNDQTIGNGPGVLTNSGTLSKSASTGTTNINIPFNNFGTLTVSSGTINLGSGGQSSGSFVAASGNTLIFSGLNSQLSASASVSGAGTVDVTNGAIDFLGTYNVTGQTQVSGGTANFYGTLTSLGAAFTVSGGTANVNSDLAIATLNISGGTLGGSGNITVSSKLNWSGGASTMTGTGTTTLNEAAVLSIFGSSTYEVLDGRTLNNLGTTNWTDTNDFYLYDGAVFNNQGAFNAKNDQSIFVGGQTPTFNNGGTFTKSPGTGTTTIDAVFNNLGTLNVATGVVALQNAGNGPGAFKVAGELDIDGGVANLSATSSITGAGAMVFNGGILHFAGTYNLSGTTAVTNATVTLGGTLTNLGTSLTLNGPGTTNVLGNVSVATLTLTNSATLAGAGGVTVTTALNWSGAATMTGNGSTTVAAAAKLIMNGTSNEVLDTRTLLNFGVGSWSGTNDFYMYNGAVFVNEAGATFNALDDQNIFTGGETPSIVNAGTFIKSATPGVTTINALFNNTGLFKVSSGTAVLTAGGKGNGTTTIVTGAELDLGGGSYVFGPMNGAGKVVFVGGSTDISGAYSVSGTMTVDASAAVDFHAAVTTGAVTNAGGSLTVDAGIVFSVAGSYTQTGGSTYVNGGTLKVSAGNTIDIQAFSNLYGSGTLTGKVTNEGNLYVGGNADGTAALLTVAGTYTQSSAGNLFLDIGGLSPAGGTFDQLKVTGAATLDGTIWVTPVNGFVPASGNSWKVLTFASRTGDFATKNIGSLTAIPGTTDYTVHQS
jgi:hypothetical protein